MYHSRNTFLIPETFEHSHLTFPQTLSQTLLYSRTLQRKWNSTELSHWRLPENPQLYSKAASMRLAGRDSGAPSDMATEMQSYPEEGVHEKHKHKWAETEDSRAQSLTRPQKKLTFMLRATESPLHPTVSLVAPAFFPSQTFCLCRQRLCPLGYKRQARTSMFLLCFTWAHLLLTTNSQTPICLSSKGQVGTAPWKHGQSTTLPTFCPLLTCLSVL